MRTLEERIKFDHGLVIGDNLVTLTHAGNEKTAIVNIGQRGKVLCLVKPEAGDMYTSWFQIKGDMTNTKNGAVIVWGARNPELMNMFAGTPVTTISLEGNES